MFAKEMICIYISHMWGVYIYTCAHSQSLQYGQWHVHVTVHTHVSTEHDVFFHMYMASHAILSSNKT